MRNRTNISVRRSTYRFGGIEHLLSVNEQWWTTMVGDRGP